MDKSRRTVVEVSDKVHKEIRKLALLNDVKIHVLTNAILEEFLKDQEKVNELIKRLQI